VPPRTDPGRCSLGDPEAAGPSHGSWTAVTDAGALVTGRTRADLLYRCDECLDRASGPLLRGTQGLLRKPIDNRTFLAPWDLVSFGLRPRRRSGTSIERWART
jgi:hypothetical protein